MKYLDEYRNPQAISKIADEIARTASRPWTIMEVCGGQTHAIVKFGLEQLLPDDLELVHGPGCPVCVTSLAVIDRALDLAARPEVIFCSFGDMLRVPGSSRDLLSVKATGGDVRAVYSPLQAVKIAEDNPGREVVFFAIGFETTAPANAMAACLARRRGLRNFSLLVSHFLVPPAIEAICTAPDCRVQGFLAAGHVCAIMGYRQYLPLAERFRIPIVVTGFEPLDILEGILLCVRQLEQGHYGVENQYVRTVQEAGNARARQMVEEVFDVDNQDWRGVGAIPDSGLRLRPAYSQFDARLRFPNETTPPADDSGCISGEIMQGRRKPAECPYFAGRCRPEHPLGAPMVSTEGACAAYYRYRKAEIVDEH
ncbi:hydrogenase formation protein HypD [Microbulbifer yueqingensis]|uniref:Hydrogenase maturation factor n=1 Tax=Microbulbifer yueqingensis TaxID=658219 RepID=A0A1G8ZSB9_9GAMM|nr:hydrogenase formation protein HypD [Microbulbifer yueqingensis]SDK18006.1 Hydrogenase maturation protein HypD [Microbulbifer yueqingensis]